MSPLKPPYYSRHRDDCLAKAKLYYEAYGSKARAVHKRCRLAKLGLYRERELVNCKRWRKVNPDKYRAIKFAQNHFSLGDCCEFCGSTVGLMRFLVEYKVPVDFVVTVCGFCRGFVRVSLSVAERERSEAIGIV